MRVIVDFEFSDEQREAITAYERKAYGTTGLPKLASRKQVRDFVELAVQGRWLQVCDELAGVND